MYKMKTLLTALLLTVCLAFVGCSSMSVQDYFDKTFDQSIIDELNEGLQGVATVDAKAVENEVIFVYTYLEDTSSVISSDLDAAIQGIESSLSASEESVREELAKLRKAVRQDDASITYVYQLHDGTVFHEKTYE
jgi:hypothetical protein